MTDTRSPGLDPRYDPAFQRGSAATRSDAAARRPESPRAVVEERSADLRSLSERSESKGDDVATEVTVAEPDETAPADPRGALRWEIAILVTGIVLIVGGVAGMVWGMDLYYGTMSTAEGNDFLQLRSRQVALAIGPPVVGVGVGALVGLIFLRAVADRRRA